MLCLTHRKAALKLLTDSVGTVPFYTAPASRYMRGKKHVPRTWPKSWKNNSLKMVPLCVRVRPVPHTRSSSGGAAGGCDLPHSRRHNPALCGGIRSTPFKNTSKTIATHIRLARGALDNGHAQLRARASRSARAPGHYAEHLPPWLDRRRAFQRSRRTATSEAPSPAGS